MPIDASLLSADARSVLSAAVRRNRSIIAARARENPNVFAVHVLRDERSGRRIRQAKHHEEWHDLINQHDRLLIWSAVDMGKTSALSIGRPLWELGRNPNLRVAILSKTKNLAMKIVRSIGQYISRPGPLHEVFPHLVPAQDASLPWTSLALTVERSAAMAKDPSIQAAGAFGNIIGSRIDLLILDDILDSVNTRTQAPRNALYDWVRAIMGRLTENARVLMVGNAWHPDDVMHRFAREPGYTARRFPVMDEHGTPAWPEHWPVARIEKARNVDFGPLDFARQLLCQPRDDDSSKFKREWLEQALKRGVGLSMLATRTQVLDELASPAQAALYRLTNIDSSGIRLWTGVDLAVQQHSSADQTCFVTVAVLLDGTRRLVNVETGRWGAPEILARIEEHNRRYQPQFIVENVGAQDYILQLVRHLSAIPVTAYTTGAKKVHPEFGIEAIAAELAADKWVFPCESVVAMHKEVFELVQEVLAYDPRAHTGDRLMAMFFAQGAIRAAEARAGGSMGARARVMVFGGAPESEPVDLDEAV